jgi:ribosomal protein L11
MPELSEDVELSKWNYAYKQSLPDSAFALILKDGTRKFPYKDKNGNVDADHVRNALARLSQSSISTEEKRKVLDKLLPIAKKLGIDVQEKSAYKLSMWDTAYQDALPDSAFMIVTKDGRRLLPYKDKNGKIDTVHVRNALARVNQTAVSAEEKKKALDKLIRIAKALGMTVQDKQHFKLSDLEFYLDLLVGLEKEYK